MTCHIREPLPKRGGNQWYRDKSMPESRTLCGAPCGYYDIPFRDTKFKKFNALDPFYVSKGGVCPECLNRLKDVKPL